VNAVIDTASQGGNVMKLSISTLALAALVAIVPMTRAHAQTVATHVNVPFAFDCGSRHFAPGAYTLRRLDFGSQELLTLWDGKDTSKFLINVGDAGKVAASGYVIFRKYGNRYFLAEYHPANSAITMEVPSSKSERTVARDYAANQPESGHEQVALSVTSGR
jgi:hypothetical protein